MIEYSNLDMKNYEKLNYLFIILCQEYQLLYG